MPKTKQKHPSLATLAKSELKEVLTQLSRKDKKLKALIDEVEFTLNIKEAHSPFEALSEAIIYQQLTGKAAATILGRFKALFGKAPFPTPAQIAKAPEELLRSAGLSRSKIAALKDLADKTIKGKIPTIEKIEAMSDDEIVETLVAVKGIGTWTAHMFLIFRLGRADVMPSGDYGVRKGHAITYGDRENLPTPTDLEEFAELWRPYRSIGSWYMWRAIEVDKAKNPVVKKTVTKKTAAKKPAAKKTAATKAKKPPSTKAKTSAKKPAKTKASINTAAKTTAKKTATKKTVSKTTKPNKPAAKSKRR